MRGSVYVESAPALGSSSFGLEELPPPRAVGRLRALRREWRWGGRVPRRGVGLLVRRKERPRHPDREMKMSNGRPSPSFSGWRYASAHLPMELERPSAFFCLFILFILCLLRDHLIWTVHRDIVSGPGSGICLEGPIQAL